uniref:F-box only protein n=1 Tax=Felis catus TaxID=9685 RepID=A0ABI7Z192_FELCA
MQKSLKRNNNSRVSGIKLNSVDAEKEKKESQKTFVELLPPEVTFKIFSQLDIRSLCRASITCRSWNYTVRNSDSLWKPHCLTLRAVCQREVDDDLESGYSWRFIYLFERDRDSASGWGAEREGERENPKQVPCFQLQSPTQGSVRPTNCEIMT